MNDHDWTHGHRDNPTNNMHPVQLRTARPPLQLTGTDGNAFAVVAACVRAAKRAGWTPERIAALKADMYGGDYDHLLQVALREFEVA